MNMQTALTPRAADAILAQLTRKGFHEWDFAAPVDGVTLAFNAFFEAEEDEYGGINNRHEVCAYTHFTAMGAWAELADGSLWAGNRDELAALIGEATVERWEARMMELFA